MSIIVFSILAMILVGSAIIVVIHPNPVFSALSLAMNLTVLALLYAGLDASFLAASQIIVYAGAIVVLLLFVLMLLNTKQEPPEKTDFTLFTVAIAIGASLIAYLAPILRHGFDQNVWSEVHGSVKVLGTLLFREYLYPFQLAGVLLVVAIVGAVLLASQRKGKV